MSDRRKTVLLCLGMMAAVLAAYANHFHNGFHFDDMHAIVANTRSIGTLRNIPRFFVDSHLFSAEPEGQSWRPLVSTSLAIDYWIARGLNTFYFHLSTFLWYEIQLVLMFLLFRRIMDGADPHPSNTWTALFAATLYGVHPVSAETVNYIVQRGDLYNTLGVVASVLLFAAYPAQRKRGWYLIPAVLAILAKAPALIFPLILLAYAFLIEQDGTLFGNWSNRRKWSAALRSTWPALATGGIGAILTMVMTSSTFQSGALPGAGMYYRLTQPWVALHYFKCFFLPTDLSADSDWIYIPPLSAEALAGYFFVVVMLVVAVRLSRHHKTRPISFGILWFFLALVPTSLMSLGDITTDHRMFFAFAGLALAVVWSVRLALMEGVLQPARSQSPAIAILILIACAVGTHARNNVWHDEDSLWADVVVKSPNNSRGLHAYGSRLLARNQFAQALPYLEHAVELDPLDPGLKSELAMAYAGVGRDPDAMRQFERSIAAVPGRADLRFNYGRWLAQKGWYPQAEEQLRVAVEKDPDSLEARQLLTQVSRAQHDFSAQPAPQPSPKPPAPTTESAETILRAAANDCRAGKYDDCLEGVKKVLALKPEYPEAYNVMAMALIATHRGDQGIAALRKALKINPEYETAKKNLAWALEEKKKSEQ